MPEAAQPPDSLPLGSVEHIGHYRLLGRIGKGGMGDVYRAEPIHLGSIAAIQRLPDDRARDPRLLARFLNEMKAIGRLHHGNLVRATDAGAADGRYYIVMELLEGLDVAKIADAVGPLAIA